MLCSALTFFLSHVVQNLVTILVDLGSPQCSNRNSRSRLDPGKNSGTMGGALVALTLPKHELYPLVALMRHLTRGDRLTNSSCAKATERETGTVHLRLWVDSDEKNACFLDDASCN